MQFKRGNRKGEGATHASRPSLDLTGQQDVLDLKLLEAIERIERVRSKAMMAVGSMIEASR
jgi:hypothetical protein